MKLLAPLGALLLLAAPAFATPAPVSVTLDVGYGHHAVPSAVSCQVVVPDDATAADVLDAAAAAGCIRSWTAVDYGSPDAPNRFVQCVETTTDVCGQDAVLDGTFWAFYFDGALANGGVDATHVHAGDDVQLVFTDYFVPFSLP